jgi:hypothetical protein
MTSFRFDIGGRARHAGRFIGRVRGELLKALADKKSRINLPQQALAEKLGVERSLINRQLAGETDLSLRSLADLAWAMDMEISFELREPTVAAGQNQPLQSQPSQNQPVQHQLMTTSTVRHGQIKYINGAVKQVSLGVAPMIAAQQTKRSA